jgi:hypothetical protein
VKPPGLATNPNSTCPPAGIEEFQPAGLTTIVFPERETMFAFQIEETDAGIETPTDQSLTVAVPVFLSTTAPDNPDPQSLSIRGTATSAARAFVVAKANTKAASKRGETNFFIVNWTDVSAFPFESFFVSMWSSDLRV